MKLRFAALIAVMIVVLIALRLLFLQGLLRRVVIAGPSMAPAYCGAHYDVGCGDCGFPFRCDAEHLPADGLATCPNCGFTENRLADARRMPAERVLIDCWPLLFREPERGDVVAFEIPGLRGETGIKRIAALPGERLAIRGGDLLIDNNLVRKSVDEWHAARILVHDNNFQPNKTAALPPRWGPGAFWQASETGFQFKITKQLSGPFFWFPLPYHHWACTPNPRLRGVPASVRDNDSYNQGELRRPLNAIADVAMTFQVFGHPDATLILVVRDGEDQFEVTVKQNQAEFVDNRNASWRLPVPANLPKGADMEFGLVDQQWFFVIDGKVVMWQPYKPSPRNWADADKLPDPPPSAVTIAGDHEELHVTNLKVWRDIYYLDPDGLSRDWQMDRPLGADEYALLGDNQPVSIDSRQWNRGAVSRTAILGVVRKR